MQDGFRAPWWQPGGHAQTVVSAVLAQTGQPPAYRRERWTTPDGDFVDVDHSDNPQNSRVSEAPLLVLFHGLEGSSNSHYARACAAWCHQQGWSFVVPHFRGCSGEINLRPRAYHSGDVQEVDWLLAQVSQRHRQTSRGPVFAVGISLGGNALAKWACQAGTAAAPHISAWASICAPLDLVASGKALGQGLNRWLYTPMFLKTMKRKAEAKWAQFPQSFDIEAVRRSKTLEAFDEAFTAPLHGFKGVQDYWHRASAKSTLKNAQLPGLLLNARNDPFVPAESLPTRDDVASSITLWQPLQGGHVGFSDGPFPGKLNALPQALGAWFRSVKEHGQSAHG
jgi:uncharacterized protein